MSRHFEGICAVLVLSLIAGCGSADPQGTRTASPAVPAAPTAATGPTGPAATPTGPVTTTTEPDAGDEGGTRVPAAFAIGPQRASPRTVTVPPFLAVELVLRSADGNPHELVLLTPRPTVVEVPASGRVRKRLAGLRRGRYALRVDDTEIGTLRVAEAEGP